MGSCCSNEETQRKQNEFSPPTTMQKSPDLAECELQFGYETNNNKTQQDQQKQQQQQQPTQQSPQHQQSPQQLYQSRNSTATIAADVASSAVATTASGTVEMESSSGAGTVLCSCRKYQYYSNNATNVTSKNNNQHQHQQLTQQPQHEVEAQQQNEQRSPTTPLIVQHSDGRLPHMMCCSSDDDDKDDPDSFGDDPARMLTAGHLAGFSRFNNDTNHDTNNHNNSNSATTRPSAAAARSTDNNNNSKSSTLTSTGSSSEGDDGVICAGTSVLRTPIAADHCAIAGSSVSAHNATSYVSSTSSGVVAGGGTAGAIVRLQMTVSNESVATAMSSPVGAAFASFPRPEHDNGGLPAPSSNAVPASAAIPPLGLRNAGIFVPSDPAAVRRTSCFDSLSEATASRREPSQGSDDNFGLDAAAQAEEDGAVLRCFTPEQPGEEDNDVTFLRGE